MLQNVQDTGFRIHKGNFLVFLGSIDPKQGSFVDRQM